ncbi:PEGA domain-containing protein [Candidatus Falkowbacteria bacterium]|uniref:PEGA domain-containing protein n=1 Tax=Candidatus Falkowbacteria bacterium CG10_big_fil_rev_8_21_14_0_10_37_18 TaxID=1974562 RepID=A0A2H0VB36_9BACT|nr:PEGA domain-containing protein [Candidatus Falkowbacteria bacterium]NCQ12690.1 PEGA domain-containing protein [Candidatus Falkowbacteria bacterium]PIR95579.1 MAG: hypothetical protein COT93_01455 [Candidatus Falkowbacteria bacterium CG10_big_fil_rev_8_21_14_0_10_37_18]
MSKKFRDSLFILFILFFLIGTILISLYASGYEISLTWPPKSNRLLIKTGMIIVDSSPSEANIFLNGRQTTNFSLNPWDVSYLSTPAKIRSVTPGEYDLRLERPGYWPLTKHVRVYPGQTNFLEDLNLFRNNLPLLITSTPEGTLTLSPNHRYLYASSEQKIITLNNGLVNSLTTTSSAPATWLNNTDELLQDGKLLSPINSAIKDYQKLIGTEAANWYYDENNNRLYYQNANSLGYLDTNQKNGTLVLSGDTYLTYEARDDQLFVVTKDQGKTILRKYSLAQRQLEQEINLPSVGSYKFVSAGYHFLTLYDEQNQTLYLINPADINNKIVTLNKVVSWNWIDDNTLLYNNNWEIYRLDMDLNANILITRVGEAISSLAWNSKKNYLIFSTTKSLNALDLVTGNITKIFQTEKISSPVLNEKSDMLYFWAKVGQQEGIYSLLLQ